MLNKNHFFLDQHGCAKNQVDGELLIGILEKEGWTQSSTPDDAELIIVNSCGFIQPAKEESINAVIDARQAYPESKIILAGCLAERYADILKEELPEADGFFGNGDISAFPQLLHAVMNAEKNIRPALVPEQKGVCCGFRPKILNFPRSVFIKITEGCNHRCAFCAIPLIRGKLRSRPIDTIVTEITEFVAKGFYEFNLIGQDLAAFTADKQAEQSGLAQLLTAISTIEGDFIIRLLYIHPDNFKSDILPIMTKDTRFLPYFDMPFQSGSNTVLRSMYRRGKTAQYLELLDSIRKAFREAHSPYSTVAFRTTFLVGFPGESDDDHQETLNFVRATQGMWGGSFVFSKEEGTAAGKRSDDVPIEIAQKREADIRRELTRLTEKSLAALCGDHVRVLIEELIEDTEHDGTMKTALGRAWFQAPEVDGLVVLRYPHDYRDELGKPLESGSLVQAQITAIRGVDVEARAL